MSLTNNMIINIYSILILVVIFYQSKKLDEKASFNNRVYKMMLLLTMLLLFIDILSRFDGNPESYYPLLNHTGNFLIFLLNPTLASLWFLYAHYQIFGKANRTKKLILPLIILNVIHGIMVILTQFYGWFYYIDRDNFYHRGPFYLISAFFTIILIFSASIMIFVFRKRIEKRYYTSLVFFALPPFLSIILQIVFYGVSLMLNSVVLSLLIVFLNIQNQSMSTDFLTGLYNRKRFENYLKEKIESASSDRTFATVMLDMNNFKAINDTFGHDIGDKALEVSGQLLKSCIGRNDFLARYGGDEFCLILDVSDFKELKAVINRINMRFEEFNAQGANPYKLSFSMGYAIYDHAEAMEVEEFQKHIDELMYKNKEIYKQSLLFE